MRKSIWLLALGLLAACNFPVVRSGDLLGTAVAGTLAAQPSPTVTPPTTATPGADAPPAGKIVYVCQYSERVERNQICLINADGSGQRVLTSGGEYDDFFPSISPDGRYALFVSSRAGRYQVYQLDIEGDQLTQLSNLPGLRVYAPAVSPNNQFIVVYVEGSGAFPGSHNLWLMNRDGSDAHPITSRPGGAWDPSWAPDGSRIMFASMQDGLPQLFSIRPDGSDVQQITNIAGIRGRNDWSPDNTVISTYVGFSWDREITLFDIDGSNPRAITDGGNNLAPSFSPDGKWIVFMSYRDHPRRTLGCEIYIMRVDGSDVRRLTDNDICDWQPRWGP